MRLACSSASLLLILSAGADDKKDGGPLRISEYCQILLNCVYQVFSNGHKMMIRSATAGGVHA